MIPDFLLIGSCRLTDLDRMLKTFATLYRRFSSVLCSLFFCLTISLFVLLEASVTVRFISLIPLF